MQQPLAASQNRYVTGWYSDSEGEAVLIDGLSYLATSSSSVAEQPEGTLARAEDGIERWADDTRALVLVLSA